MQRLKGSNHPGQDFQAPTQLQVRELSSNPPPQFLKCEIARSNRPLLITLCATARSQGFVTQASLFLQKDNGAFEPSEKEALGDQICWTKAKGHSSTATAVSFSNQKIRVITSLGKKGWGRDWLCCFKSHLLSQGRTKYSSTGKCDVPQRNP